jgi:hypothetical protein
MATSLFMGGIFNIADPILGIPLYMWSWLALLILIGIAWAIMYYRGWKPLAPLHGLYYALKNGSSVAFIFDALLIGELVAERDAKCIFNYADDAYEIEIPEVPALIRSVIVWFYLKTFYYPTKYLKNISPLEAIVFKIGKVNKDVEIARLLEGGIWERSAAVVCAGVPVDIVVDTDNWTIKTSRQHKIVSKTAREWNEINPDDQIHSYQKFGNYIMDGKMPCPEGITISKIVPWQRIDAAFPLDLDKNEWAGKIRQMAKDQETADAAGLNKFAIWVLIIGVLFAFVMLLFRFITIVVF